MAEGYTRGGVAPIEEGGTGGNSFKNFMPSWGIDGFQLSYNQSHVINYVGNLTLLFAKRGGYTYFSIIDHWGSPKVISEEGIETGSALSVVKNADTKTITVTNTPMNASVAFIAISFPTIHVNE